MHSARLLHALLALIATTSFTTLANGTEARACNFSAPSASYEQNADFVRVLNQFGNILDIKELGLEGLSKKLLRPTSSSFYYDPAILRTYRNAYGDHYACEHTGLASINYNSNDRYPPSYEFCFVAKEGTLDDGEVFVESILFLPRKKWINYLDFPNRDGAYGTFLRTTRLGARIRFAGVSGFYYLKYGDRYLNVRLSIVAKRDKTTVSVKVHDSTEFVLKQIDCENTGR